ncbi:MAG: hypothetical protein NT038_02960 [Euryarchaeota archaeon]|nr:hypothetical protein [Euryarchaeota archaeon]
MHSKDMKIDVSEFWCRNERCRNYGKKEKGNIVPKERYGKDDTRLLKCKTRGHCISENYGTRFFQLKTPRKEVIRTLALFHEKVSIRGLSRATGHDKKVNHKLD